MTRFLACLVVWRGPQTDSGSADRCSSALLSGSRRRSAGPRRTLSVRWLALLCLWAWIGGGTDGWAQVPRVLPEQQLPEDARLGPLKDLNGYFPFQVPASPAAWVERAARLRRQVQVATGLWPFPNKTPLNAVVHGKVEREGFTVERVFFESVPDHFVTGLLFRPEDALVPAPGVLSPHGHGGRLQDHGPEKILQMIEQGQEQFEASGRYPKLARCAHLARMGCVVFIYDMIGYADSQQIPEEVAHGLRARRPEMEGTDRWGFFSAQAELRLQSIFGLQTWNTIRALDFLCSLPDVDPDRIGVTGGSGGGTQSILICALDDRPTAAFPQGMVSTSMQGGCPCENACLLRIGTGNVELAALFAPKPQAMTAADDWTRDMMTQGYPELQQLYAMLGAPKNVACTPLLQFPHNYNYVTRAKMYAWLKRHLDLSGPELIVESDYRPLSQEELRVWSDKYPPPPGGPAYEQALTAYLQRESDRQLAAMVPRNRAMLAAYRQQLEGAFEGIIGRSETSAGDVERIKGEKHDWDTYWLFTDRIRNTAHAEELPIVSLFPKTEPWNGQLVLWMDGRGKRGLWGADGALRSEISKLLDHGVAILGADLLYQGEFLSRNSVKAEARFVGNPSVAAYTLGYNHSLAAQRVHDILTLVQYVSSYERRPKRVDLVGIHGAAPWVAAAAALSQSRVDRVAVDTQGFRFGKITSLRDENLLPGAVKYGDLPGILSLVAPRPLWLAGEEGQVPVVVRAVYDAWGASANVRSSEQADRLSGWLLSESE